MFSFQQATAGEFGCDGSLHVLKEHEKLDSKEEFIFGRDTKKEFHKNFVHGGAAAAMDETIVYYEDIRCGSSITAWSDALEMSNADPPQEVRKLLLEYRLGSRARLGNDLAPAIWKELGTIQ